MVSSVAAKKKWIHGILLAFRPWSHTWKGRLVLCIIAWTLAQIINEMIYQRSKSIALFERHQDNAQLDLILADQPELEDKAKNGILPGSGTGLPALDSGSFDPFYLADIDENQPTTTNANITSNNGSDSNSSIAVHHDPYMLEHWKNELRQSLRVFSKIDGCKSGKKKVKTFNEESDRVMQTHQTSSPRNVGYFIQISGEHIELFSRLIEVLYDPENAYLIHFDRKISQQTRDFWYHEIRRRRRHNIHFMHSERVTYQGVSMILNSLGGYQLLLNLCPSCQFFINLSGADYPLIGADNLRRMLNLAPSNANYVSFFPTNHWKRFGYRFFRVAHDSTMDELYLMQSKLNKGNPSSNMSVESKFKLPNELIWRKHQTPLRSYWNVYNTTSEAWLILSRPFVSFIVNSHYSRKMLSLFEHTVSSPEHYFSMLLMNHPMWRKTIINDAFRLVIWKLHRKERVAQHPYKLDAFSYDMMKFLPIIESSGAFFGRKMSVPNSSLMEKIDHEFIYATNESKLSLWVKRMIAAVKDAAGRVHTGSDHSTTKEREMSKNHGAQLRSYDEHNVPPVHLWTKVTQFRENILQ